MRPVNLPLWRGVQEKPGGVCLPFALGEEQGLVRLSLPRDDIDRITRAYGCLDYSFITPPPGASDWANRLGDWYFKEMSNHIKGLEGKTILEIGAGSLYIGRRFVRECKVSQYVVCDPTLSQTSSEEKIQVINGYFSENMFRGCHFEGVVILNTLEHVSDPFLCMAEIRQLLLPGAWCFIVVPECERGLLAGDWGMCVHEHLSYFTQATLSSLLGKVGFRIEWVDTAHDTLLVLARADRSVSSGLSPNEAGALITAFEEGAERMVERFRLWLDNIRSSGQSWGIHGCQVGLSNNLGLLGVEDNPNLTLFDGDKAKEGKYLPIYRQPIYAVDDVSYRAKDGILVAATAFYDEILRFALQQGIPPERIQAWGAL